MEILLIAIVVIIVMTLFRPQPRTQVVYVPLESATTSHANLGCLPLIVFFVLLLAFGGILLGS